MALKKDMAGWYQDTRYKLTKNGIYSVTRSYNEMLGTHNRLRVANLVWKRFMQPKHRFIIWLANQNRLLNKARML